MVCCTRRHGCRPASDGAGLGRANAHGLAVAQRQPLRGAIVTYGGVSLFVAIFVIGTVGLLLEWARARGLTQIFGPKGFSALDGMGLLVKGFDQRPALGIAYNPAYYAAL